MRDVFTVESEIAVVATIAGRKSEIVLPRAPKRTHIKQLCGSESGGSTPEDDVVQKAAKHDGS